MTTTSPAGERPAGPARSRVAAALARPDEIRRHNLARLLREVHLDGPLSRAELTQRLRSSRSTIGALVADLCALRILEESVPAGGDRAGRPSHVVAPRRDGPYAIAVDVEVDRLAVAAVAVGGALLWRKVHRLRSGAWSTTTVTRTVADAVGEVAAALPCGAWPVGIGISVPGSVHTGRDFVEDAPNLHWHHEPLGPGIRELVTGLPVALGNDADMGVLAEHLRGAARDALHATYLTGKVGVGAGILVNGQPLRGAGGLAGEIGHAVIDHDGPPCHCGGRGCVEGLIGEEALLRHARRREPPAPEVVAAVLADARAGDPVARAGVRQVARGLGQVLATLVNLLNPEVIVLGGALAGIYQTAGEQVLAELESQAMPTARAMVDVRVSALAPDSELLGAAELAFQELLTDPLSVAER